MEKEKKFFSLGKKVFLALFIVAVLSMLSVSSVIFYRFSKVKDTLGESYEQVRENTVDTSSETTRKQAVNQLLASTKAGAELADDVFSDFKRSVEILAADAARIYDNEGDYAPVTVERPDAANAGTLTVQLLYSSKIDEGSEAVKEETLLLGNLKDTLLSVHESYEPIVADCIATESGIMIMADLISDTKFDEDGGYLSYEADGRPWYIGVKSTGQTYFTKLSRDAHTSKTGIMCAAPVYHDGRLMAVVEAGMYLDNLERSIADAVKDQSEDANICIINEDGELVCSTAESGILALDFENMADLRQSDNAEFSGFLKDAVLGSTDITKIELDGVEYYAASAPLATVGWTYLITVPSATVDADTQALSDKLYEIIRKTSEETDGIISSAVRGYIIIAIIILVLVTVLATVLSRRLVASITRLTGEVKKINGEDLDFAWDRDGNDEIQVLAVAFGTMTERIRNYIKEVQMVTAEKERIGAELDLATKIQADMLPNIFPAFPEREDFDIHASMTPAKEVGGDFYDFFLIDDDHLAIVMADVSGKGVPAALFMMMSKILINDVTMMAGPDASPAEVLTKVNDTICQNNKEEMFVTVWLGILTISTGHVVAANAGHEYPILKKADGKFELFKDKHGFVIGGMAGMRYKEYEFTIEKGGVLFLYTDGVAEATDAKNELFGIERTLEALNGNEGQDQVSPERLLLQVKKAVNGFVGEAPQFDDLTMLAIKIS